MRIGTYDDDAGSCTMATVRQSKNAQQAGVVKSRCLGVMNVQSRAGDGAGLSVYADGLIIGAYEPLVPGRLLHESPKRASRSIVWVVDQAAATMGGNGSCSRAMRPIARLSSGVSGMAVKP